MYIIYICMYAYYICICNYVFIFIYVDRIMYVYIYIYTYNILCNEEDDICCVTSAMDVGEPTRESVTKDIDHSNWTGSACFYYFGWLMFPDACRFLGK